MHYLFFIVVFGVIANVVWRHIKWRKLNAHAKDDARIAAWRRQKALEQIAKGEEGPTVIEAVPPS